MYMHVCVYVCIVVDTHVCVDGGDGAYVQVCRRRGW